MAKKKTNIGFLTGLILGGVFVIAAILFAFAQYNYDVIIGKISPNGFTLAFGNDTVDGNFIFFLPFIFAILGAVAAVLAAFRVIKIRGLFMYAICGLLALLSVIFYLVEYFHVMDSYKGLIDLSENVKWTFMFWGAFALHCIALAGSVFGAVMGRKK